MEPQRRYRLKQHHTFERDGRKYVADLETSEIVPLKDVEWEILSRYASQTRYQIVEGLKERYKLTTIFEGIERLEQLGQQDSVLSPIVETTESPPANLPPKLLVPFHFTREKSALDYATNLSRYQFVTHLAGFAELETLAFSEEGRVDAQDLNQVRVRNIDIPKSSALAPPWYAMEGYDGILLFSQFVTDDLLYYRIPDVPIVHCIKGAQRLQHVLPRVLLTLSAFQSPKDTLVVGASWMQEWLTELGIPEDNNVRVIPDGIDIVAPIGDKALAKQYTASLFDKPMFVERPVVGLISGFEPKRGAAWISEFAQANPHLAIFVYDTMLEQHHRHPPENMVIFSADDEETRSVLPIFFQALDLVCFPAMPGTPLSIVLEAMAYRAPCVVMTKYGMPAELEGAGVAVKSDWDTFGDFYVSMAELSEAVNAGLQPSATRVQYENAVEAIVQQYTWKKAAQELVGVFAESSQRKTDDFRTESTLFPPVFCRQYEPDTGAIRSCAYRFGMNRYDGLEPALAEVLGERHTPAEVESVFKHFGREETPPDF